MPVVQIPLRAGLEEGIDDKQMPIGKLTLLENGVWKKDSLIEKRDGTIGKTKNVADGASSIMSAKRLAVRGNELCLVSGTDLYALTSETYGWQRIGRIPNVSLTWNALLDTTNGIAATNVAIDGNLVIHAWTTGDPTLSIGGTAYVQIVDRETGTVMLRATKLGAALQSGQPRVVSFTGSKAIVVVETAPNLIVAYSIDLGTMTVAAGVNLRVDAQGGLDVVKIGTNFVVLYGGTVNVHLVSYNSALALQAGPVVVEASGGIGVQCSVDGAAAESLYVLYAVSGGALRMAVHNPATLAQTVAPFTIEAAAAAYDNVGVCRLDATNAVVAYTHPGGRTTSYKVSNAGVKDANSERGTHCARLVSSPFVLDGRCYAVLADYDFTTGVGTTFNGVNTVLVEIETSTKGATGSYVPHRYVAKIDHLIGSPIYGTTHPAVSGNAAFITSPFLAEAPLRVSNFRTGVRLLKVGAQSELVDGMWKSVTFGLETYFAAGGLFAYDGQNVFDYGFSRPPILATGTQLSPAGNIAAGTYVYATYPEYRSAAGVLHRGPPIQFTFTYGGAPSQGTFNFVNVNVDAKHSLDTGFNTTPANGLRLPIFRSVVGSTKPRRLTMDPAANVLPINLLTRTHQFVDTRADNNIDGANAVLATRPLLYTEGGILPDEQPPAPVLLHMHQDRLWAVDGSRQQVWFSKSFNDDRGVAPGFSTSLRMLFGQNIHALATLEDKIIIFGEDWISLVLGEGPSPNGLNSSLSSPQSLLTDVGTTNPRSVVTTPDGVMFLTQGGKLYLLTRQLELVWVGKAVQDKLAAYPDVVAAVLVPKKNQVRFCCNNAGATAGIVLVFDYVLHEWSVFKYSDQEGVVPATPFADAILHQGAFTFVTPGGQVYVEDEATSLDDSENAPQWVPLSFELAWLSAAGPMGWQRVRRVQLLGEKSTSHNLTLALGFNHRDAYAQSYTFVAQDVETNNDCPTMRVGCQNGASPLCKAIRVRVTDATPSGPGAYPVGTGKGGLFSAIALEIEPQEGPSRHGARRSKV